MGVFAGGSAAGLDVGRHCVDGHSRCSLQLFMADRKIAVVDISPANASPCPLATTLAVRPCRDAIVVLATQVLPEAERTLCGSQEGGRGAQEPVGAPPLLPSEGRRGPVGGGSCHFWTLPFSSLSVPRLGSLAKILSSTWLVDSHSILYLCHHSILWPFVFIQPCLRTPVN